MDDPRQPDSSNRLSATIHLFGDLLGRVIRAQEGEPAFELEEHFFPQKDWFIDIIHERILPIPGYTPTRSFNDVEMIRRAKLGV